MLGWYPVVAAVIVGLLTYLFARELTDDRRVAIAAVAMLAVLPVHVQRSGLGYGDHHAFDYIWLMLTATAVVMLARQPPVRETLFDPDRKTVLGILGVGFGVSGQVLAWEAGPLLLLPLLLYFPVVTLLAARDSQSSLWANAPLLVGLAIASMLAALVHLAFGWHSTAVAFTPALLFVGGAAVTLAAEAVHRADLDVEGLPVVMVLLTAGFVGFMALITLVLPSLGETLFARIDVLIDSRPIVEYQPLFSLRSNGWLVLLGPPLFVAMAGFVWASVRAWFGQRHWLVAALYGWSFLFLASLQQRFAGELSPFVAVFAGLGLVSLAWKVDVARVPAPLADAPLSGPSIGRPTFGQVGAVLVLFALIAGFSAFQSPVHAAKAPIGEGEYETAQFADEYATEHDLDYPENFVMSKWWRNRMYNYFVSGEADSYNYARNNYIPFFESTDPVADGWYEEFEGRVGFVVVDPGYGAKYPATLARLQQSYGSRANGVAGLAHYRLIYEESHEMGTYQLFSVVPGHDDRDGRRERYVPRRDGGDGGRHDVHLRATRHHGRERRVRRHARLSGRVRDGGDFEDGHDSRGDSGGGRERDRRQLSYQVSPSYVSLSRRAMIRRPSTTTGSAIASNSSSSSENSDQSVMTSVPLAPSSASAAESATSTPSNSPASVSAASVES